MSQHTTRLEHETQTGIQHGSVGELFHVDRSELKDVGGLGAFIAGAAMGALVAYLFDPVSGNYRLSLVRDKAVHLKNEFAWYSNRKARDLANRARGTIAKASEARRAQADRIDDETLVNRVRSSFGRIVSHSKAVKVSASNGEITLSGPILAAEVEPLLACVRKVKGVGNVINQLEPHESAEHVPSLQS